MKNEELFLIYTDVVGSTPLDEANEDPISWRETSFLEQLKTLLSIENSLALKSIGDALFITVKSDNTSEEKRKELCKKVLACTYKAYTETKRAGINSSLKKEIKIRAVVHLINNHHFGERIANEIINAISKGEIDDINMKKSDLLIKALKDDIFGTEVNKAARIQSLVRADAILISEEIAQLIEDNNQEYFDKKNKLFYITFEYKNEKFQLHSPVPVIKLKGLKNISFKTPLVVWQLDNYPTDNLPALATEFKSYQMFRFLLTGLKKNTILPVCREKMQKEVFNLLTLKKDSDHVFNFYNDFLWDVIDRFEISPIKFSRYPSGKMHEKIAENKENYDGEFYSIRPENSSFSLIEKQDINATLIISKVALCSFQTRDDAIYGRQILEAKSNKKESEYVCNTEPQTIDIYSPTNILFKNTDEAKGFSILMFFGIYVQHVSDSNNERKIFRGLKSQSEELNITPALFGLNSGLVDGFVLFKIKGNYSNSIDTENIKNVFEEHIVSILNKYKPSNRPESFFSRTFPISLFMLNCCNSFKLSENNLNSLKRINKMSKESN